MISNVLFLSFVKQQPNETDLGKDQTPKPTKAIRLFFRLLHINETCIYIKNNYTQGVVTHELRARVKKPPPANAQKQKLEKELQFCQRYTE